MGSCVQGATAGLHASPVAPDAAGAIRKRAVMIRRVLRLKDVKEATGLSRSSIYALRKRGLFPPSVRIGPKAVG